MYEERARLLWSFLVRSAKLCVRCHYGKEGNVLVEDFDADHILRRQRSLKLMFDLRNGACMCRPCHRTFRHDTSPEGARKADAWVQERHSDRLLMLEELAKELAYNFSYRGTFDNLWAELNRRSLHEEFRFYLARHPEAARVWADGE